MFRVPYTKFLTDSFKSVNSDVTFLLLYALVAYLTYKVSKMTNKLIEKKGINIGGIVINKLKQKPLINSD